MLPVRCCRLGQEWGELRNCGQGFYTIYYSGIQTKIKAYSLVHLYCDNDKGYIKHGIAMGDVCMEKGEYVRE